MQVGQESYQWLVSKKVLRGSPQVGSGPGRVRLSEDDTALMESGTNIAFLIAVVHSKLSKVRKEQLPLMVNPSQMKEQNTASARFYNWTLIEKALNALNLPMSPDTKSLILSGDVQIIGEVVDKLRMADMDPLGTAMPIPEKREKFTAGGLRSDSRHSLMSHSRIDLESQSSKRGVGAGGGKQRGTQPGQISPGGKYKESVNLNTMGDNLADTKNCLEFFLVSICRNFEVKPKQAAALMTHNNTYLVQVVIKGLKGHYEPIVRWYQEMYAESRHLTKLVEREGTINATAMVLRALQPGLYTKHLETAQWACRILAKMAYDFHALEMSSLAWQWFVEMPIARSQEEDTGLDGLIFCAKKFGNDVNEPIGKVFTEYGRYNYYDLFSVHLRSKIPNKSSYFSFLTTMVNALAVEDQDGIIEPAAMNYLIESAMRQAQTDGTNTPEDRVRALEFLTELWLKIPDSISPRDEVAQNLVSLLRRAARDVQSSVRYVSLSLMFQLLETFTREKNSFAPLFFKTLTYTLVQNHGDSDTREFLQQNFINFILETPTIPVGIIIEPLVKQIQSYPDGIHFQVHDFHFYETLAEHPKLSVKSAIQLLDILARLYLTNDYYATMATNSFLLISERYVSNPLVTDFLSKFVQLAFQRLQTLQKQAATQGKKKGGKGKKGTSVPILQHQVAKAQMDRNIQRSQILELTRSLINFKEESLNEEVKEIVLANNFEYHQRTGHDHPGMLSLLDFWGDPSQMLVEYEQEMEEKIRRENEEREMQERDMEDDDGRGELALVPYNDGSGSSKLFTPVPQNALVPYVGSGEEGGSKDVISIKAKRELEKIKKRREQKAKKAEEEQNARQEKLEKQKQAMKKQFEKRKIQHGVATRNTQDEEKGILFKEGAYEQMKSREKKMAPEIKLLQLDEEEPTDREAVEILLAKYKKLFKYLFNKYANSQYSVKNITSFDSIQGKKQTINNAETSRMLKEHDLMYSHISREELITLVRLINLSAPEKRADLTSMPWESFSEFMLQLAVICFTRAPLDLSGMPPLAQLRALMDHMARVAKQKHFSTFLYEDPEASALGDQEILRELNRQIEMNPNYELPEGYKKVTEKDITYEYTFPPMLEVPPAKRIAIELLEELVERQFGFHILEPIARYETKVKVRPIVKKVKAKQAVFMEPVKEKPKAEDIEQKVEAATEKAKERRAQIMKQEIKPRLGVQLKLGVAKASLEDKEHVQETAEVLEEILTAVEKGLDELPPRRKYAGEIPNKVKEEKKLTKQEEEEKKKEREEKMARRKEQVKRQLEELKQKKEEETKEKKEREAMKEQRRKERKEAEDQKWAKKIMERQEKVKQEREKKALLEEEKEAKKMRKKEKESEILKEGHQKFLNEQKRMLVVANKKISKERAKERIEKANQEDRQKNQAKLTQKYFEAKVKAFEDKRIEKLKRMKEVYEEYFQNPKIQDTLARYGSHLRVIFDSYARLNVELNRNVEEQYETLNLKKCLQFAYDFNLTPTLCQADDYIYLYNNITKEVALKNFKEKEERPTLQTIDFKLFQDLLVRVAVIGRKQLGFKKTMAQIAEEEEEREEQEKIEQLRQEQEGGGAEAPSAAVNKKKKSPKEEELWEPEMDATGMNENNLIALFDYFGLDLEDDLPILKRRLKELRNLKQINPSGGATKLPKVPMTLKEERAAKKKQLKGDSSFIQSPPKGQQGKFTGPDGKEENWDLKDD